MTRSCFIIWSEEYETYLCCFSKASDDLAMWNYYIKNDGYDGYCIGLQSNILERKTKETAGYNWLFLIKM